MNHVKLCADIPVQARSWRNDLRIHRFCRQNHLISEAQQAAWLIKIEADPTIKMLGILGQYNDPVGVCGFTSISTVHGSAEFSLYIAADQHGKGYGKAALIDLLHYGFIQMGLNRIWGDTFDHNPAMQMFLDVGFKKEGTLRQSYYKGGKFIDSHIISILRSEYDHLYG